ncbi:MAG: acyl-ACP--UDP-N-acetylglucosamine O-acyltransferase [Planctomycetaceae bacterium]|nr:acyl-ACP--UDP-N-acetylglucosamine O-acyltransferase [Planctomycetaceae bacterium]
MPIHPTAVVDPRAVIDPSAEVGPYVIIDGPATVGAGTILAPHVQVLGETTIGRGCHVHAGAILGDLPQDKSFSGGVSYTRIGDEAVIREYVTIHRGTQPGTQTVLGDRCMLMAHAHVGHNCQLGNDVVLVNGSLLGGYVHVGDRAMISGNAAVHQFVRVGELAMIAGLSKIVQDVLPYMTVDGPGHCVGVNVVGMRRSGMNAAARAEVKEVYRRLYRQPGTWRDAVDELASILVSEPGLRLLAFLRATSKRGIGGHSGQESLKLVVPPVALEAEVEIARAA